MRFDSSSDDPDAFQDSTQRFTNKFNMIRNMQRERNAVIFFATDSSDMRTLIHQNFDHDFFMVDYLPVDETGRELTEASAMRTIIELFLLGSSDMLFLMEKSKFSMVGLSLNHKNPHVVYFFRFCYKKVFTLCNARLKAVLKRFFSRKERKKKHFAKLWISASKEFVISRVLTETMIGMIFCSPFVGMSKAISLSRFLSLFCDYPSVYRLENIQLLPYFKSSPQPLFLFCLLRKGRVFVEGSEVFVRASCFLPLYPFSDLPMVLVFRPHHCIAPNDLCIPLRLPSSDDQIPSIRGKVVRKALSVLSDQSYLFSLSVENGSKELIVRADESHSWYCYMYLPLGSEIILSNYCESYFSLSLF